MLKGGRRGRRDLLQGDWHKLPESPYILQDSQESEVGWTFERWTLLASRPREREEEVADGERELLVAWSYLVWRRSRGLFLCVTD